ncbi:MAG: 2-amino-4-hydroxy-6-hydroxymethyldihydropteridine diphosphokinase [Gemmatimonadaceae bacterium]
MTTPVRAYLSLGANLGDRLMHLARAARALQAVDEVTLVDVSAVYETAPLGAGGAVVTDMPAFLNCAIAIETTLSAAALRAATKGIEHTMGRGPHGRWESRVIDIDLVLFGDARIATPELTVPHASMLERAFVLRPLVDLDEAIAVEGAGRLADLLPGLAWQGCTLHTTATAFRAVIGVLDADVPTRPFRDPPSGYRT